MKPFVLAGLCLLALYLIAVALLCGALPSNPRGLVAVFGRPLLLVALSIITTAALVTLTIWARGGMRERLARAIFLFSVCLVTVGGLALSGCSQSAFNQGIANINTAATAAQNLNDALVKVDITIINDLTAQAKLLAPYQCGAYALGTTLVEDSTAASAVNAYLQKSVAANLTNVAVQNICLAAGYPATVTAAPAAAG